MPITFFDEYYTGPPSGDLHFVHYTDKGGLVCLAEEPFCIRSLDSQGDELQDCIDRVYRTANMERPQAFSCCSAMFESINKRSGNIVYGDIAVLLKLGRVVGQIIVVNGDLQNIAQRIGADGNLDSVRSVCHSSQEETLRHLRAWRGSNLIEDSYCEARLMRQITPQDIDRIYALDFLGDIGGLVDRINEQL